MEKIDELFDEMTKNMVSQNKLRDEMHACKEKLESLEREYYGIAVEAKTSLLAIVSLLKTYNDSKKELDDIAIFLASYGELELHNLCANILRYGIDISELNRICDVIVTHIRSIIPDPFLYIGGIRTAYIPKYVMTDVNIRNGNDYDIIDKLCRMISKLELLHSYLNGLYTFKGGTIDYYKDLLPEDEY